MCEKENLHQMADVIETVEISNVELNKLKRIANAAELIVKDYWVTLNQETTQEEFRKAVLDYKGWCEYYV